MYRNQKLLEAVRAAPCMNCGVEDGTVCAAHSNQMRDGKGIATETYSPFVPVNTSATWKGWLRKRWILRARYTVSLSSGDNSSMPRIAMMS